MTDAQASMILEAKPVLCLDADEAGREAMPKIAQKLRRHGFDAIRYVRPCREYKDWNGLLVAKGPRVLAEYIKTQERDYETIAGGDWEGTRLGLNGILK
jgi:DNA primase